jgi:membrane-associated protein
VPFVRTFAPFVAGISGMDARRFLTFNVAGAALWVAVFVTCGYYFGRVPWVSDHLGIVVVVTVALSLAPAVTSAAVAWVRRRLALRAASEGD